jgi:hypothetical protein
VSLVRINRYLVSAIFAPWWGLADEDDSYDRYRALGLNDESALRQLVRDEIASEFWYFDAKDKDLVREALRYTMCRQPQGLERIFHSDLPPFEPPSIERMFEIIWEELFPGHLLEIKDQEEFEIIDEIEELNRVLGQAALNADRYESE